MEKKILDMEENLKTEVTNQAEHMETRNKVVIQLLKATITEIGMTIENARIECPAKPITHAQLLRESIIEIGMTNENARIECPAKPITHAFIHFRNDDERNSEHVEKRITRKEVKDNSINGRKRKIPSEKNGVRQILHSRET